MKQIAGWALFLIFLYVLIFTGIFKNRTLREIQKNGILINAKIVDKSIPTRGGSFYYTCTFTYNGKTQELTSPTSIEKNGSRYLHKVCPAIYSPVTNNIRLLLTEDDFTEYNVPLTDSLRHLIDSLAWSR